MVGISEGKVVYELHMNYNHFRNMKRQGIQSLIKTLNPLSFYVKDLYTNNYVSNLGSHIESAKIHSTKQIIVTIRTADLMR